MVCGNDLRLGDRMKRYRQGSGQIKGSWVPSRNVGGARGSEKAFSTILGGKGDGEWEGEM